MIPHHFFYQLVLFGLLWLFVMLYYAWPNGGVTGEQRPVKPITPRRTRSNEPKAFAGLIRKPYCAACEQGAMHRQPPPPVPPDPMPPTNRRPRQVDASQHCCPHPTCAYRGWVGRVNLH